MDTQDNDLLYNHNIEWLILTANNSYIKNCTCFILEIATSTLPSGNPTLWPSERFKRSCFDHQNSSNLAF